MSFPIHSEFLSAGHFASAYRFLPVPGPLQGTVQYIWESRFEAMDHSGREIAERSFAQLSSSIVFTEGSSFNIHKEGRVCQISGPVVIGPHTVPVEYYHNPENRLKGIKLHPAAFYGLFKVDAGQVRNEIVRLRELGQDARSIQDLLQLLSSGSGAAGFRQAQVARALNLYLAAVDEAPGLEAIAERLHLTGKSLYRYFIEILGLPPKKAFCISRLRLALAAYAGRSKSGRRFSVYDFGYEDRSHFYKELRQYTSLRSLRI